MIIENIKSEIKEAMISKNELKKNTLKLVVAKANELARDTARKNGTSIDEAITDEICIKAIEKEVEQLEKTMTELKKGHGEDSELYKNSMKSIELLSKYLPKKMSEEEIKTEVAKLIEGIDTSNMGLVMKTVMASPLKEKANGKVINKIVMEILKG